MNGATKDYQFGHKNNWRRWGWNETLKRLNKPRNRALVLYLAGQQDLDRAIAVGKGFLPDNLLIVERDTGVVEKLRQEGKVVMSAEIEDILLAWPPGGQEIDVIWADLCSGLEPNTPTIYDVLEKPCFSKASILLNLQRGRDSRTNEVRQLTDQWIPEQWKKHRGHQFLTWNILETMSMFYNGADTTYPNRTINSTGPIYIKVPIEITSVVLFARLLANHNFAFSEYQSGTLIFDSVVFQSPHRAFPVSDRVWPDDEKIREAKKQISAALAIRTMRLNGHLAHSPRV